MPLLDIATPQPSFRNQLYSIRFQRVHHVSFIFSNRNTTRWRYFRLPDMANGIINPGSVEMCRGSGLMIKAVATLEPRCFDKENDNAQQLGIDSTTSLPATDKQSSIEDEKEMLRRKRISKANKGNSPWNKGMRHSPETRQLISERTRIAMQSPKVKMKLLKAIHGQSVETRLKIGAGVRRTWERRRERQMVQEHCHFEWLNLIAEASRKGLCGQEELQWDSYEIMAEQLKKEWQESVEQRKKRKPKGCKRAPKSPEQRRKISEAIAAKWADPLYRDRVHSGIAKYRGKAAGITKPTWVTSEREPKKINPPKKSEDLYGSSGNMTKSKRQLPKFKTSSTTMYKDPHASSKLEMIKDIRAQRAAADTKISEAVSRAKLLIAEAQGAAEALEVAAAKSPMAQASLVETRKLIDEAISYIKTIEMSNTRSPDIQNESGSGKDMNTVVEGLSQMGQRGVNGVGAVGLSDAEITEFGFSKLDLQDEDEDEDGLIARSFDGHVLVNGKEHIDLLASSSADLGLQMKKSFENEVEADGGGKRPFPAAYEKQETRGKGRRWVCGKLVEDD